MSADVLREAARLMRERAEAATPGVWVHTYGGIYVGPRKHTVGLSYDALVAEDGYDDDEAVTPVDAEHIASWHPSVALAVADWLDETAAEHESDSGNPTVDDFFAELITAADIAALAVARAYLNH